MHQLRFLQFTVILITLSCAILFTNQQALAFGLFDTSPAWPLCGRITENPPAGWQEHDGCPAERWGNPDHTDAPISSTFGPRLLPSENYRYDFHRGIDLATPTGTPMFAFADGVVRKAGPDPAYSDPLIQLRHYRPGSDSCTGGGGCYHTNYLHAPGWVVAPGDTVRKGDLVGYSGVSSSGFEHLHFEIRDASAQDVFSAWNRDAIHPLMALVYPDREASNINLTLDSVDATNPMRPVVSASITIPMSVELDLARIEAEVYEWQPDGSRQAIVQPGNTPQGRTIEDVGYWVNPPFYDMVDWNRQYSYKDNSTIPWQSFHQGQIYESPYWRQLPPSYDPNVHLDAQDPTHDQAGLFNGWRLAPNHTNAASDTYILAIENHALTGTDDAAKLCIRMRALDVRAHATLWQTWNCDVAPSSSCGDGHCGLGESCDGRKNTLSCPSDCPGKTKGKRKKRFCFIEGACKGAGCPKQAQFSPLIDWY